MSKNSKIKQQKRTLSKLEPLLLEMGHELDELRKEVELLKRKVKM